MSWENRNYARASQVVLVVKNLPAKAGVSESRSVLSAFLQPHGLYSSLNSPGQNTGVGSLSLLQGTFPTQGSNLGLPHRGQILYQLSYKGSPRILEWAAYSFSSWSSQPRNWTRVSFVAGRFFTNWAIKENCQHRTWRFNPWIGKISWSRKW